MPAVTMKELLESGVHFGHQTRRWNPRMKPYIFTERGGIYIIDLQKTIRLIEEAYDFVRGLAADGKMVLFVGTKKQCQDTITAEAQRASMPFVSHRWLGGLLTNYATISQRIKMMHELRRLRDEGQLDLLPTKEQMNRLAELRKLEQNLGGVADMDKLPAAVFVIDPRRETIVIRESRKLGVPVVALVDTNCNPDEVDFVIPGNDDAIRSCALIIRAIADGVVEGRQLFLEKEVQAAAAAAAKQEAEAKAAAEETVKTQAEMAAAAGAGAGAKGEAAPAKADAPVKTARKPAAKAEKTDAKQGKASAAKAQVKPKAVAKSKTGPSKSKAPSMRKPKAAADDEKKAGDEGGKQTENKEQE